MWQLYMSIALGGVILMVAPPKDVVEQKSAAHEVGFLLTWPLYLLLDIAMQYFRGKNR
jgi:uncharacterized membrane protein YecN with MAPEG domain